MEKLLINETTPPEEITSALLECVVMPNGEVISSGKSIGWINSKTHPLGQYLYEHPASKMAKRYANR